MMDEQWWEDTIKQVRREENDQITAKMTIVVEKSLEAVLDRLEHGDHYYDVKTKSLYRVTVRLKDMTMPLGILVDKRQLLRGDVTSRTEKLGQEELLKQLGEKFENFAKSLGVKEPQDIETIDYIEVIDNGK